MTMTSDSVLDAQSLARPGAIGHRPAGMRCVVRVNRIVLVVAALCLSCPVAAGEPASAQEPMPGGSAIDEIVVYPTGDAATDVARVQDAVDSADHVLLKAVDEFTGVPTHFEFGENGPGGGFVVLSRDVSIRGERVGSSRTTIAGGFAPLRGVAWDPVTSSVRGLDFAGPGVAALFVTGATGVEFVDNRVRDVVGLPDWIPGISKGQGVWIVGLETVTGEILIADNLIEDVDAHDGYGLALYGFSADARIERNTIRGIDTAGILVAVHTGEVWITDNRIAPGLATYPTDYGHGSGIIVGSAYGGSTYVQTNTIDCVNPWAIGIFVAASNAIYGDIQEHAVIEKNRITLHGSNGGGVALMGSVKNTRVAANQLVGEGAFAFFSTVWITPEDIVESNAFVGNNISLFESFVADALFDVNTRDNVFMGKAKTYIDLGVDNWVSGTSTGPPPMPPGRQLSRLNEPRSAGEAVVPTSLTS